MACSASSVTQQVEHYCTGLLVWEVLSSIHRNIYVLNHFLWTSQFSFLNILGYFSLIIYLFIHFISQYLLPLLPVPPHIAPPPILHLLFL